MRSRGFALVVGLFSVMLLFFFATIVMDTARQNFAFSRHSAQKVQAHFAAQAGTQWALHKLNQPGGESWEATLLSGGPQQVKSPDGTSFQVSLESLNPTRINIMVTGQASGVSEKLTTLVKKKPAVSPLQFAVMQGMTDPSQPDRLYQHEATSPSWKAMRNPWEAPPSGAPGTAAPPPPIPDALSLAHPSGDSQGNLACISRQPGLDDVLYYSAGEDSWRKLPALPVAGSASVAGLNMLPSGQILVLVRRLVHHDQICTLLTPTDSAWQVLPQPPDPVTPPTQATAPATTTWEWEAVASDANSVFALQRYSSGIFRFSPDSTADWSSGTWEDLPLPRKVTYTIDSKGHLLSNRVPGKPGTPRNPGAAGVYPDRLNYLACDPSSGQLFARSPGTGIDTIYRFTPDGGAAGQGIWTPDPLPPPGWTWTQGVGWERKEGFVDLLYNSVDHASNLNGVYRIARQPDIPYTCDLSEKQWKKIWPVSVGGGTRPEESGDPGVDICGFGGGGLAEAGRTTSYVALYTYP